MFTFQQWNSPKQFPAPLSWRTGRESDPSVVGFLDDHPRKNKKNWNVVGFMKIDLKNSIFIVVRYYKLGFVKIFFGKMN